MSPSQQAMTLMFAPVPPQNLPSQNKTQQLTTNRLLLHRVFPLLHHEGLFNYYEDNQTLLAQPLQPLANQHPQALATLVNPALHE